MLGPYPESGAGAPPLVLEDLHHQKTTISLLPLVLKRRQITVPLFRLTAASSEADDDLVSMSTLRIHDDSLGWNSPCICLPRTTTWNVHGTPGFDDTNGSDLDGCYVP